MKNIILTGASSGIGEATAKILASNGHKLLMLARRADKLSLLQQEIGNQAESATCDVTNYLDVKSTIDSFERRHGGIDVLINNAGIGYFDNLINGTIEHWHE